MAAFPTTVATDADLYIAVNATSTQLTDNPLTAGATTVNVVSTTGFPTVGFISIDNEIIKYTGTTATSFTGCTRGADGTAATSHVQNSQVFHNVIAAHHNVLKDEIIAVEQNLSDRLGLSPTHIRAGNGSATAPIYSFASETGLGLYRTGASAIGFAFGTVLGAEMNFTTGYFDMRDNLFLALSAGAAATPTLANRNNLDTGLYFATNQSLVFTVDTTPTITLRADNSVDIGLFLNRGYLKFGTSAGNGGDGTAANPILTWENDPDTGVYHSGTNEFAISAAGTVSFQTDGSFIYLRKPSLAVDGSATNPAYAFSSNNNLGLYRSAAHIMNVAANGVSVAYFTHTGVGLRGTTTNDSASTGDYGEFLVSTTGNVASPGTNQWFDITSLSLTAGDWDVTIIAANNSTNYAACTDIEFGLGTTAGNVSPGATQMLDFISMSWAGGHLGKINQTLTKRFSLSATTTVYAKALMTFSAGTQNGLCQLRARRIR